MYGLILTGCGVVLYCIDWVWSCIVLYCIVLTGCGVVLYCIDWVWSCMHVLGEIVLHLLAICCFGIIL